MGSLLKGLCLGAAAAWLLAAPAAHAFTVENKDAGGGGTASGFTGSNNPYAAPKFDIEEQAKNFRSPGSSITNPGAKTDFSTPYGNGSMFFGVQQGPAFGFGAGGMSPSVGSRANRMDFERMVTPEGMR
jgi:hypothetical protein